MNLYPYFRKILLFCVFLPLISGAQTADTIPQEITSRQTQLAATLQKEGILRGAYKIYQNNIGFSLDTARHKAICCDALFREIVRGHLNAAELSSCTTRFPQQALLHSTDTAISVLYTPFEAGRNTFVLVENALPGSRSALLVVLRQEENGAFSVIEQSPLCRSRTGAGAKELHPAH